MPGRRRRIVTLSSAALLGLCALPAGASQVRPDVDAEAQLLRDATVLEQEGNLAGAARTLRVALRANPRSLSALIALERVFGMTGRTADLLPHLDTLLAREPASVIGHQMRVRAWTILDNADSLEHAADEWIRASPRVETPYREVARAWRSRSDYRRAVRVLERGRKQVRRSDALALELGDAYADARQFDRAADEWARAVGPQGEAFLLVQRRVAGLPNAGADVIPRLVDRLFRRSPTPARLRAAAQLAVGAGLEERATRVSEQLADQLEGAERDAFMIELARRADGAGLDRLAFWAYAEIIETDPEREAWLPLRARMAELALVLGDTATAVAAFRALEGALEHDAPARRQAIALRIEVMAEEGDTAGARRALQQFRAEYGAAAEIDGAAARLANALIDARQLGAAEAVLAGLEGPRASLARGRIRINEGDFERARDEFLAAAPLLHGAEATQTIGLATLLGRLSADGAALVSRSLLGQAHAGGLAAMLAGAAELPAPERPAVLDYAADMADRRGMRSEAEQIRREIVEEFPRAPEAPSALLALARSLIARRAPADDVRLLLERMIVEYPRSALVPQARRELAQLAEPRARE